MSLSDLIGSYDFDDIDSLSDALAVSVIGEDAELIAKVVQMVRLAKLLGSRVIRTHVSEEARRAASRSRATKALTSDKQFMADTCPDGYEGWDPVEGVGKGHVSPSAAEYGSAFINAKGQDCYATEGVRRARAHNLLEDLKAAKGRKVTPQDKREIKVTVQMVRDFVRVGAELAKRLNDIGNADIECRQVNQFYGDEPADVQNRREFCGTLLRDGKKKCRLDGDRCTDA